jgi:hypothetical protein
LQPVTADAQPLKYIGLDEKHTCPTGARNPGPRCGRTGERIRNLTHAQLRSRGVIEETAGPWNQNRIPTPRAFAPELILN